MKQKQARNTAFAIILAALALPAVSRAGQQIRLPGIVQEKTAVALLSSPGGAVTLSCGLGALQSSVIPASTMDGGSGEDFVLLSIPDAAYTGEIGKPRLPTISAVLDVPQDAVIELSVDGGVELSAKLPDIGAARRVAPALAPVPKIDGARARFALDNAVYASGAMYPGKLAEVDDISSYAGLARGHRLAAIRFYPVQYSPATGELRYHPRLQVSVRFRGGNSAKTEALIARDYSPDWEGLIRRLVVNYAEPPAAAKDSILSLPIYYDIFYGGTYAAAAQKLADWKRRKGYAVRTWNATGWSARAINDTIINQSPKATYLVVMSDPDGPDPLPPSATGSATGLATDLYYAETDETGYLPDMFNGRISVKTAAEADIAVDKVVRYEQADFGTAGTAWLKRALLIAGYDGAYQSIGIATNAYCKAILEQHGYAVDALVMADGEGKARVVPKVNAGTAWTIYTAHGGPISWHLGGTDWHASELSSDLTNQDMYTLPIGHCCNSGEFQYSSDCFGETWPKLAGKGGVSYFGSVPETYWDEDDWLQRRYFDAIYDSVPGVPGLALNEIGRFTQYGLYWIELNSSSGSLPNYKRYYFEAYHVFNDPAMDFWTGVPRSFSVSYPALLPRNGQAFTVTVRDQSTNSRVRNALVCAVNQQHAGSTAAAYTDSLGAAALPYSFTAQGDTVRVTVTKHDYHPHLGYARMGYRISAAVQPRTVDINVPTAVSLTLTDPDSGNKPLDSVRIYLNVPYVGQSLIGVTNSYGMLDFTVCAGNRGSIMVFGQKPGSNVDLFEDSIRISAPTSFELMRVAPNPFRQTARIPFNMYQDASVTIAVYNLLGQKVRTLIAGWRLAGYHSVQWDGKDERGVAVASGIYFCRFNTPWSTQFQRMTMIR